MEKTFVLTVAESFASNGFNLDAMCPEQHTFSEGDTVTAFIESCGECSCETREHGRDFVTVLPAEKVLRYFFKPGKVSESIVRELRREIYS